MSNQPSKSIEQALIALKQGTVIGMPTETVYGLAGDIDNPEAIRSIFRIKNRPFFDPLIVHTFSLTEAQKLTTAWNSIAEVLANRFWPGPLTLVMPKADRVSDLITSGLQTVGIRIPKHAMSIDLLRRYGIPLAAPSANKFGKTSPTTAEHVRMEFKDEGLFVLDGGPCQVGLESTVLSILGKKIQILRKGQISETSIKEELARNRVEFEMDLEINKKHSPGHLKHHYMPEVPLILVSANNVPMGPEEVVAAVKERFDQLPNEIESVKIVKPQYWEKIRFLTFSKEPSLAARELYSLLRSESEKKPDLLVFQLESYHDGEQWESFLDRVQKAASLVID